MENRFAAANRLTEDFVRRELDFCREKVDALMPRFVSTFPAAASKNGVYPEDTENFDWTTSFYSGMLWLLYEHTGEEKYLTALGPQLDSFYERVEKPGYVELHDMGFLYDLSCYPAVILKNNDHARSAFLMAADFLTQRWVEKAGILQAWGDMSDKENMGRMIIDCLLNLPLLYQASRLTGDKKYYNMAYSHAKQAQKYIVRPDDSTYHTYFMDVDTGAPRFGKTAQGYSDDSCWARGQVWGVYGFTLSYVHTGDRSFLDTACRLLDYYLARLPEDYVNYWDLCFTDGDQPRDTSSTAIVCCGIQELLKHLPMVHPRRAEYENALHLMMRSLADNYTSKNQPAVDGLLLHGVYSIPHNNGVDECCIWGDYYYMEALCRMLYGGNSYWI